VEEAWSNQEDWVRESDLLRLSQERSRGGNVLEAKESG